MTSRGLRPWRLQGHTDATRPRIPHTLAPKLRRGALPHAGVPLGGFGVGMHACMTLGHAGLRRGVLARGLSALTVGCF